MVKKIWLLIIFISAVNDLISMVPQLQNMQKALQQLDLQLKNNSSPDLYAQLLDEVIAQKFNKGDVSLAAQEEYAALLDLYSTACLAKGKKRNNRYIYWFARASLECITDLFDQKQDCHERIIFLLKIVNDNEANGDLRENFLKKYKDLLKMFTTTMSANNADVELQKMFTSSLETIEQAIETCSFNLQEKLDMIGSQLETKIYSYQLLQNYQEALDAYTIVSHNNVLWYEYSLLKGWLTFFKDHLGSESFDHILSKIHALTGDTDVNLGGFINKYTEMLIQLRNNPHALPDVEDGQLRDNTTSMINEYINWIAKINDLYTKQKNT